MNNGLFQGITTITQQSNVQYWEYKTSGLWQKPSNCTFVRVFIVSGGTGGAKGNSGVSAAGSGGASGASGLVTWVEFLASDITTYVNVVVGAGGLGVTTAGGTGGLGGKSAFLHAYGQFSNGVPVNNYSTMGYQAIIPQTGPTNASAGSLTTLTEGYSSTINIAGAAGGATTVAGTSTFFTSTSLHPGAGGSGGGAALATGANGGASSAYTSPIIINFPVATGGISGSINGQHGDDAATTVSKMLGLGVGGGGGYGNLGTANGGVGGNGGFPGGGGGGGGAAYNGTGGNGGNGGNGVVRIWTW